MDASYNYQEFVFPGGFMKWYQNYKPSISSSISPKFLIIVNVLLVLTALNPINLGFTYESMVCWLCISSVLLVNAWFHINGTIRSKAFSPGLITSVLLYAPLALYGNWFFLSTGDVSIGICLLCLLPGIGYHLFSSLNHRRRATGL
jgi:hypothetical protein